MMLSDIAGIGRHQG